MIYKKKLYKKLMIKKWFKILYRIITINFLGIILKLPENLLLKLKF